MIILTKEINEILNTMKLQELTVRRTSDGYLELVGRECEKSILVFSSMPISKKLTAVEREILKDDYILDILAKHSKKITSLITILKDTTATDKLKTILETFQKKNVMNINIRQNYQSRLQKSKRIAITFADKSPNNTEKNYVNYDIEKELFNATIKQNGHYNLDDMEDSIKEFKKMRPKIISVVKEIMVEIHAIEKQEKTIEELHNELAIKCSL